EPTFDPMCRVVQLVHLDPALTEGAEQLSRGDHAIVVAHREAEDAEGVMPDVRLAHEPCRPGARRWVADELEDRHVAAFLEHAAPTDDVGSHPRVVREPWEVEHDLLIRKVSSVV